MLPTKSEFDWDDRITTLRDVLWSSRPWHRREQQKYELHSAIRRMLDAGHEPRDWHLLVLQWPHTAEKDRSRIAYTQSDRKGEADIQTVTSLGKYLRQHFHAVPDHVIRDAVAFHECGGVKIVRTSGEMVDGIQNGPHSCMRWESWELSDCPHPYRVYDPEYGWHMALRYDGDGQIVGRALLLTHGGENLFVRTYKRCPEGGYSHADEQLHAVLESMGYVKEGAWPEGAKLRRISIRNNCGFLAPYLDGNTQRVEDCGSYLRIDSDGDYECTETDGDAECSERHECGDCGDRYRDEDDGRYVGYHSDCWVCESCAGHYTHAIGRNARRYWVHDNDVVEAADGESVVSDYSGDAGYVMTEDGELHPEDDTFTCEVDGCIYHVDQMVRCEETGDRVHKKNSWTCEQSGNVYSDNVDHVSIEGTWVHPDYEDEYREANGLVEDEEQDEEEPQPAAA